MSTSSIIRSPDIQVDVQNSSSAENQSFKQAKEFAIERFEKSFLMKILAQTHWNISRASELAQLDRRSIQRLVSKYHIQDATKV
jgi:DNA-binding NtrC family response regulator